MKIAGIRLLEDIKLKYLFFASFFLSLLFPQFNIEKITHPLLQTVTADLDSVKSHITLHSIYNAGLGGMMYNYNNKTSYHDTIKGYNFIFTHLYENSEINSYSLFQPLYRFMIKRNHDIYTVRINKKYNTWKIGTTYQLNKPSEYNRNYAFLIKKKINANYWIQYNYSMYSYPTTVMIWYEDSFNYKPKYFSNHQVSSIQYGVQYDQLKHKLTYEKTYYNYINNNIVDFFEGGKHYLNTDLSFNITLKSTFNFNLENSTDSITMNFIKDGSTLYQINMMKHHLNNYSILVDYKLNQSKLSLEFKQQRRKYFLSSRVNISQISTNLEEVFTVPIINILDSLNLIQNNIYLEYFKEYNNTSYTIGMNYCINNINYYHRATTPPFNPLIPIIIKETGEYDIRMLNIISKYSTKIHKLSLIFSIDTMIPLSSINLTNNSWENIWGDISKEDEIKMLTTFQLSLSYQLE